MEQYLIDLASRPPDRHHAIARRFAELALEAATRDPAAISVFVLVQPETLDSVTALAERSDESIEDGTFEGTVTATDRMVAAMLDLWSDALVTARVVDGEGRPIVDHRETYHLVVSLTDEGLDAFLSALDDDERELVVR